MVDCKCLKTTLKNDSLFSCLTDYDFAVKISVIMFVCKIMRPSVENYFAHTEYQANGVVRSPLPCTKSLTFMNSSNFGQEKLSSYSSERRVVPIINYLLNAYVSNHTTRRVCDFMAICVSTSIGLFEHSVGNASGLPAG